VLERHERGGYHSHMAVRGWQDVRLLRSLWRKSNGGDLPGKDSPANIQISYRGAVSRAQMVRYLCKYITKDCGIEDDELLWRKKVMGSKFAPPIITDWFLPARGFATIHDVFRWAVLERGEKMMGCFRTWSPPDLSEEICFFSEPDG